MCIQKREILDKNGKRDKDIMIRFYKDNDIDQLYDLIQETIAISYPSHYPEKAVQYFKNHHSKKNIKKRNETGQILVIEKNGKIIGTGSIVHNEITGLFIHPNCQKTGLGNMIMTELESIAKKKGVLELKLYVSLPSKGFYEKLKYEISEPQKIDVGGNQSLEFRLGNKKIPRDP